MSAEKFLVYSLLIAFYAVYAQFSDTSERRSLDRDETVASVPAPTAAKADPRVLH